MLLRIREWRHHFHLSQATLAVDCGLSRETISAIETGRHKADTDQLQQIADALNLRVSDLLDERPCPTCPYRQAPPPDPAPPAVHLARIKARARRIHQHTQRVQQVMSATLHRLGRTAGGLLLLAGVLA